MIVSVCKISLVLPSSSLKEKRRIIRSIMGKTSNKFNVSISEVAENAQWGRSVIGMSSVSSSLRHGEKSIEKAIRFIESERVDVEIIDIDRETFTGF